MAAEGTRRVVPRHDLEGSLGSGEKRWEKAYIGNVGNVYDSVADMKADLELREDSIAFTKGYHTPNDGGHGFYNIREKEVSDVEDGGSIIFLDNGKVAKLIVEDCVFPQQFGAVCDGITDDAEVLQKCVTFAGGLHIPVKINANILIDNTITVPSNAYITSETSKHQRFPKVIMGANCTTAFVLNNSDSIQGLCIYPLNNVYKVGAIGIDCVTEHVDAEIIDCTIVYLEKAIVCRGRNINVDRCLLSHCKYGVYFDFLDNITNLRGLNVQNTRFHGIGEEEVLKFVNSAAIYCKVSLDSNLTIQNCICDQSGTFFEGYARRLLMTGNFVESFAGPILKCEFPVNETTLTLSWLISANYFGGKTGTLWGQLYNYPTNLVYLKNMKQVQFVGNTLLYSAEQAIILDNVSDSMFNNNTFTNIGIIDNSKRHAFELSMSNVVIQCNLFKHSISTVCYILHSDSGSIVTLSSNRNFDSVGVSSITAPWNSNVAWQNLYKGSSGVETPFTTEGLKDGFYFVRRTDGQTAFLLYKAGNYISKSPFVDTTNGYMYYLDTSIDNTTLKITFTIKRLTLSTGAITSQNVEYYLAAILL